MLCVLWFWPFLPDGLRFLSPEIFLGLLASPIRFFTAQWIEKNTRFLWQGKKSQFYRKFRIFRLPQKVLFKRNSKKPLNFRHPQQAGNNDSRLILPTQKYFHKNNIYLFPVNPYFQNGRVTLALHVLHAQSDIHLL